MVGIAIFFHCLYYEYQIKISKEPQIVNAPTSLNAIFFATILLASRLKNISSVFVLLFSSLCIFSLGPYLRQELRRKSLLAYETLTIWNFFINFSIILFWSPIMAFVYCGFQIFLCLGLPLLFIYAYKYKNDIRGPWDVPTVKEY